MDTVLARDFPGFVKQNRERIGVTGEVLPSFEHAVDLLSGDEDDCRVAFREFIEGRLELSQLPLAVRSPRAADENDDHRTPPEIGKADDPSIECRE